MARKLYSDALAARVVAAGFAGTPYRPSSASEYAAFDERWCCHCRFNDDCTIPGEATIFGADEPEYPAAWRIGADGQPDCSAYRPVEPEPIASRPADLPGQLRLIDDGEGE